MANPIISQVTPSISQYDLLSKVNFALTGTTATKMDGVTLTNNMYVVLSNQTTNSECGIYLCAVSGSDYTLTLYQKLDNTINSLPILFNILSGTNNSGIWMVNNPTGSAINFTHWVVQTEINVLKYTETGLSLYNPSPKLLYAIVELWGGGGASGGCPSTNSSQRSSPAGGGGGGWIKALIPASVLAGLTDINVYVGVGGAGVSADNGNAGGSTYITINGYAITAFGGSGGLKMGASSTSNTVLDTAGGTASSIVDGVIVLDSSTGGRGGGGVLLYTGDSTEERIMIAGGGGGCGSHQGTPPVYGQGATGEVVPLNGTSVGVGGRGGQNGASEPASAGGNGANGLILITEYLSI